MKQFNFKEFSSKSWKKRNSLELKQYISHAIKEINRREYNDKVSREAFNRLGEEITGFTKQGNLSGRVIGKTREELLYEARNLHNFLEWDYTSDIGQKELQNKFKEAFDKYNANHPNAKLTEETYEIYVELMNAFKDLSKAYDSNQIREWVDTLEENKDVLSVRDLQKAMLEYADEYKDERKIRHKGLDKQERKDAVNDILERLIYERR